MRMLNNTAKGGSGNPWLAADELGKGLPRVARGDGLARSAVSAARMSVTIDRAVPSMLSVGDDKSLWYHIWGNPEGTPVLFVHGGPGQCVADYNGINSKFFDADKYRVIEVDQ